jgi:hypothetical protein
MYKKTSIKTWLVACCLLVTVLSQAQTTGNPYWNLPSQYWPIGGIPVFLPQNSYSIVPQPGYTVQPGYGYNQNAIGLSYSGTTMQDGDGYTVISGPNNMYCNSSGVPLFSIVSGYIFNQQGSLIDTLIDTISLILDDGYPKTKERVVIKGYAEVCVVPNPANCQQYYVFTAMPVSPGTYNANCPTCYGNITAGGGLGAYYNLNYNSCSFPENKTDTHLIVKPYFTMLDVSKQGSYMPNGQYGKNMKPGAVGNATAADLYKATGTQVESSCSSSRTPLYGDIHYAATKVYNPGGTTPYRLLFVINDAEIITYKVTGTTVGSNTTGVQWLNTQSIGTVANGGSAGGYVTPFSNLTELEIYQNGSTIDVAFGAPYSAEAGNNTLVLTEYDTNGVYKSGAGTTVYGSSYNGFYIEGVEFSPNGSYVYVTHSNTPQYPYTVDAISWSSPSTIYHLSSDSGYSYSQIEKGTDGSLYLIQNISSLSKIASPNTASSASITTGVVTLSGDQRDYPAGAQLAAWFGVYANPVNALPDQIDQEVYGTQFNATLTCTTSICVGCCQFYYPFDKTVYIAGQPVAQTWTTTATTQTWRANTSTSISKNPIALSSNTTSTVTIGEELRIPAGMTITIDSMTLKFSPQARLIIENGTSSLAGGKLILNNCTLTVVNTCGGTDMWPGVQVWGSPGSAQSSTYQGWLQATSGNSVIENAYIGVLAGCDTTTWLSAITPAPTTFTLNSQPGHLSFTTGSTDTLYGGGGIVQCSGVTFLNNQRHVVFNTYSAGGNASWKLYECTFKNTTLLTHTQHRHHFIGMYNYAPTTAYSIDACAFIDTVSANYSDTGLYSRNSSYHIDQVSGGSPYVRSSFSNFVYAIRSNDYSGSATITVDNTNFINNTVGIYLGMVNNATIESDTFKIHLATSPHSCAGLVLDNCTGYWVQDNYNTSYTTLTNQRPYGILVTNSGGTVNGIFRNSFSNLYVGSQAQYCNYSAYAGIGNDVGLLYLCNTFSTNTMLAADIYVPQVGSGNNLGSLYPVTTTSAGIGYAQGAGGSATGPERPTADNQFSHTTGGKDFYIESGAAWYSDYTFYCPTGSVCAVPGYTASVYVPYNGINAAQLSETSYNSSVPTCTAGGDGHRTMYVNPITQAMNNANTYKQTCDSLKALIDGGSTSDLLSLINGNNNASAVLNSLNSAAPYLSDTVLISYLKSSYSASNITQILTACSPLSNKVNNAVTASNLSAGIKTQVAALQTGQANIDWLNRSINSALSSRHLSLDVAIRYLVRTATTDSLNMGDSLLKVKAMELLPRVQVETGLSLRDSSMAANALTQVASQEGQSNFVKLNTILVQNLNVSAEKLLKNASVLSTVQTLATDSSDRLIYYKANALLSTIGKSNYQPYFQPITTTSTQADERTTQVAPVNANAVLSASTLVNQPNPFKESTVVQATIVEKTQNAYIVITDMVGNEIARYAVQQGENNITVNAGSLDQAMMFCTLVVDGVKIKTNKMVLIK